MLILFVGNLLIGILLYLLYLHLLHRLLSVSLLERSNSLFFSFLMLDCVGRRTTEGHGNVLVARSSVAHRLAVGILGESEVFAFLLMLLGLLLYGFLKLLLVVNFLLNFS